MCDSLPEGILFCNHAVFLSSRPGKVVVVISQTVEYALRAVVTIAQHGGRPCTAKEIAAKTQVPAPYLSKLMQGLAKGGIVSSQRGLHGGFVLSKSPDDLTLWEVIESVEPFQRIRKCPLGIVSHTGTLCPLHQSLDDVMARAEKSLRETTVTAILQQPGAVSPLCEQNPLPLVTLGLGR